MEGNIVQKKNNTLSAETPAVSRGHKQIVRQKAGVDTPFLVIVIVLLCLGTIAIFSASYAYAQKYLGDTYYYLKNQLMFVGLGLVLMFFVSQIDYLIIKRFAYIIFAVVMLMMIATAIPGVGTVHHGARRWLEIGPISFQPSELCKLAIVIAFSKYFVDYEAKAKNFINGILIPGIVIVLIAVIMFKQSHLSGLIILTLICVFMMFIGGSSVKWLLGLGASGVVAIAAFFISGAGYRVARIQAWIDPWAYAKDEGWQTIQSLYAISQGGLFGNGIGESMQKNLYLPEPQNDFIFSIWCEELGFIGAMIIIVLFALFAWRGVLIAMRCTNKFASFMVLGIVIKVVLQALLNIAVVTNTIPNTGISLPFFSYGGTSLLFLMIEMGIVLSVSRYSYLEKG